MEASQIGDWFPFPTIRAFRSRKKAKRYYKTMTGGRLPRDDSGSLAYVRYIGNDDESHTIALMVFDGGRMERIGVSERYAIMAHECSHVIDSMMRDIDEDSPSGEFRAYAIQCAMMVVAEQLGESWLTRPAKQRSEQQKRS